MEAWTSDGQDYWQGQSGCGLKLRQGNGDIVERSLQLVCNLETGGENPDYKLNPEAEVFVPRVRPSTRTKQIANKLFKDCCTRSGRW